MSRCSICNNALARGRFEKIYLPYHERTTFPDIERSAVSCKYCQILFSIITEERANPDQVISISEYNDTSWTRSTHGITFTVSNPQGVSGLHVELVVSNLLDLREEEQANVLASGCTYTGSTAAAEWAKDQIKVCKKSHENCNLVEHSTLTDRVLAINYNGSGTPLNEDWLESDMRLHEPHSEQSVYAALSHRWGGQQPLRLLGSNISEFRRNISWSLLPKTFQHAIVFARKLGMPYIWIDSLCIIQDSKDDWLEQSGKMAGIYESSFVTLAATTSESGQAGCFAQSPSILLGYITDGHTKVPVQGNELEVKRILRDADAGNPIVFIRGVAAHPVPRHVADAHLPLLKREWVYQERLLSPRVLHFGKTDIVLECNHAIRCYCNMSHSSGSRNPLSHPVKPQHAYCLRSNVTPANLSSRWVRLVEEYTELDLTFQSDRLPAIAGVAKQLRRTMTNPNYMAGLWEESLVEGMSWYRKDGAQGPRPSSPSGPSWSWASVPGAIKFSEAPRLPPHIPDPTKPTVEKVVFDRHNDEEFMILKSGSVTLHGYVVEVRQRVLQTTNRTVFHIIRPGAKGFHVINLDYEPDKNEVKKMWKTVHPKWSWELLAAHLTSAPIQDLPKAEDMDDKFPLYLRDEEIFISVQQSTKIIYCLAMGRIMNEGGRREVFLLVECVNAAEQVYRRIGEGSCTFQEFEFWELGSKQSITIV